MEQGRRLYVAQESDEGDISLTTESNGASTGGSGASLLRSIRRSVVGECDAIPTPLGPRKITYVDHTATGRSVGFIERYINEEVAPLYANTHTTTSYTGFSAHSFLSESRSIIRESVNASERFDCVLFTGRGATAASNVLAHYLARPVSSATVAASAGGGVGVTHYLCPFPGCGRSFGSLQDGQLHARTHPDGEQAAHNIKAVVTSSSGSNSVDGGEAIPSAEPLHVIVGPWAHHSSLLPWKEAGPHVRMHMMTQEGPCVIADISNDASAWGADLLGELQTLLSAVDSSTSSGFKPRIVGVFTTASNVTGAMLSDPLLDAICALLHSVGGVACFDYAASAPHCGPINMNPTQRMSVAQALASFSGGSSSEASMQSRHSQQQFSCARDAIYFSTHKLTGGVGGPGVLVLKRALMTAAASVAAATAAAPSESSATSSTSSSSSSSTSLGTIPASPGGGTVFFVHSDGTPRYLANDEEREEAGSPDTLGAVRGALAIHLARGVGWERIAAREGAMAAVARRTWAAHPNIKIVGTSPGPRTPVVSFVVAAAAVGASSSDSASPRLLHHWGFICALLNDLFGIQARGGCLCAGPYVQALLGYGDEENRRLEGALLDKDELLRPGVIRVSFPYYMSHAAFRHTVRAVEWVASNASSLLHLYQPIGESGEWRMHRSSAGAAVAAGYRSAATAASTSVGMIEVPVTASSSSSSLAAATIKMSARDVIATATPGAASSSLSSSAAGAAVLSSNHIAAATSGGFKQHPRRWLQEMRIGGGGGDTSSSGVWWPSHRLRVRFAEDTAATAASSRGASGSDSGMLVEDDVSSSSSGPRPLIPESVLYRAYEAEAKLLLAGLSPASSSSSGASSSVTAKYHLPSALLSPAGQRLRWFALAGDVISSGNGSGSGSSGEEVDYVARVQTWQPPPTASAADSDVSPSADPWSSPSPALTALLSADDDASSQQQQQQLREWDGQALSGEEEDEDNEEEPRGRAGQGMRAHVRSNGGSKASSKPRSAAVPPAAAVGAGVASGGRKRAAPSSSLTATSPSSSSAAASDGSSSSSSSSSLSSQPPPAKRPSLEPPHQLAASASTATVAASSSDAADDEAAKAASTPSEPTVNSDAAAAPSSSTSSSSSGVQSGLGVLRGDMRRDPARAARIKATLKVIATMPQPPHAVAKGLTKALGRGIREFGMIKEGDRLLVGLSGGKDSLTLLILLASLQARAPVGFDLAAATVDPQYPGFDPSPLKAFCAGLGIPYFYESQPVIAAAGQHMTADSICAWCSRMKRGILYSCARREGYNVLVLGQHLDDFAESFMMSAMRNGLLRTMKAHYVNDDGDLRIIRPLVFARERLTREFATACALPIINENCPACYSGPTERYHVKKLLAGEEALNPALFGCLEQAMRPLMTSEGSAAVRAAAGSGGKGKGGGDAEDDEAEGGGGGTGGGKGGLRIGQSLLSVSLSAAESAVERIVFSKSKKTTAAAPAQSFGGANSSSSSSAPSSSSSSSESPSSSSQSSRPSKGEKGRALAQAIAASAGHSHANGAAAVPVCAITGASEGAASGNCAGGDVSGAAAEGGERIHAAETTSPDAAESASS